METVEFPTNTPPGASVSWSDRELQGPFSGSLEIFESAAPHSKTGRLRGVPPGGAAGLPHSTGPSTRGRPNLGQSAVAHPTVGSWLSGSRAPQRHGRPVDVPTVPRRLARCFLLSPLRRERGPLGLVRHTPPSWPGDPKRAGASLVEGVPLPCGPSCAADSGPHAPRRPALPSSPLASPCHPQPPEQTRTQNAVCIG